MITCPLCSFENKEGAVRCSACGARLATRARVQDPRQQTPGDRAAGQDRGSSPPASAPEKGTREGELHGRTVQVDSIVDEARKVAVTGSARVVHIEGASGSGKSALASHAARQIRDRLGSFMTVFCACRPGSRDPFSPVESLVSEILHVPAYSRDRDREALEKRVLDNLRDLRLFAEEKETEEIGRVLVGLMSRGTGAREADPHEAAGGTAPIDRIHHALARVLEALTATRHLAVIVDDIHNGTPEGLWLLGNLRESIAGRPILWMFTKGEEDRTPIPGPTGPVVKLTPLGEWEVALVLQDIFPDLKPFPEELWQVLARSSGGNPGTLHHLVGLLVDERVLVLGDDGVWRLDSDKLQVEDLPLDREAVLQVRFEQLDSARREFLTRAAISGKVFWDDLVMALARSERVPTNQSSPAQIWPDDQENLVAHSLMEELEHKGFISPMKTSSFPEMTEYVFTSEGFREHLESTIPEEKAADGHRFAARWLEMASGPRRPEFAEMIATHWEMGSKGGEACAFFLEAADVARRRYLFDRAIEMYERALGHVQAHDAVTRMNLLHDLGSVHQMRGAIDEAMGCFAEMLAIAWTYVSRGKAGAALSKIGRLYRTTGDYGAARAYLERALALFQQAGDRRGIASTLDDLGYVHYLQGHYDRAEKLYAEAVPLREEMGDRRGLALSWEHLGQVDRATGNLAQAEARFREVLSIRRSLGDEDGVCSVLNALGVLAHDRGSVEAAVAIWREALDLAVHTGNFRMQEFLYNNLGEALVATKRLPQAEGYFKHALELSMSLADRRAETEICRNLGLLYVELDSRPLGREYLNRSLGIARDIGSREAMGLALRALGQLEGHSVFDESAGPAGAADSYFQEAMDIFDKMGNETELLKTLEELSRYLFDHGRIQEAVQALETASGLAERQGEETSERVRREIDRMRRFA